MYEVVVILNKEKTDSKLVRWTDRSRRPTPRSRSCCRVTRCVCVGAQGFLLESEYDGDNGHPRMSWINPSSASNSVLLPGDVLLEINGKPATSHTQAAKVIAAIVGDVVLKVLAQKPRGGRTTLETIDAAAGVDAGVDAATKVQSLIRGQQSRKAMARNAPEPVPAERVMLPGVKVSGGLKEPPPGMPPHSRQEIAVTTDAERDAAAAKEAAATAGAERDAAAAKMQSLTRGRHSRKKVDSATDAPPAKEEAAATADVERDAAAAKMQSLTRGRHSRKKMDSAPNPPPTEQGAAVATDAERDAAAAKMQSLTRGRHSRKKVDSADPPPAEQEEMGTDELEAAAEEGGPEKHRRRRSVKAIEEHRHRRSTKPEDVGAESSLAELSLAEAPPNRHRHRRRSTRKTEELDGEADRAEEGTQHQPTQPTLNSC